MAAPPGASSNAQRRPPRFARKLGTSAHERTRACGGPLCHPPLQLLQGGAGAGATTQRGTAAAGRRDAVLQGLGGGFGDANWRRDFKSVETKPCA